VNRTTSTTAARRNSCVPAERGRGCAGRVLWEACRNSKPLVSCTDDLPRAAHLRLQKGLCALDAFAKAALELRIVLAGFHVLSDSRPDHLDHGLVVDRGNRLKIISLIR
jgi:hypothetical protein